MTAKVVILPEENPADIKAQADAWHDACQPKNHDEKVLVERLALASRQLERIAKAEDEVIDEQVRYAQVEWDKAQQNKLVDALRVLPIEPVRALVELRSFGAGVSWLLARWDELELAFEAHNGWPHLYQIQKALKFCGYDSNLTLEDSHEARDLAMQAISCQSDPQTVAHLAASFGFVLPPTWRNLYTVEEARAIIRARIEEEIVGLKQLAALFQAIDPASRAGASKRALVPIDSAQNRLTLRYRKTAATDFDKSLRSLQKLQSDRKKAAEIEAQAARDRAFPNEANHVGRTRSKRVMVGSTVTINRVRYDVVDTGDGSVLLCPLDGDPGLGGMGVNPAPDEGV